MSELQAAAERIRRMLSGEVYRAVYGDCPVKDADYAGQYDADRRRLAEAICDPTPRREPMTAQTLFDCTEPPKPPRAKPRVLMHVVDAGDCGCELEGGPQHVRMKCGKCGHETGWIGMPTVTAAKRGLPCPKCNPGESQCPSN